MTMCDRAQEGHVGFTHINVVMGIGEVTTVDPPHSKKVSQSARQYCKATWFKLSIETSKKTAQESEK